MRFGSVLVKVFGITGYDLYGQPAWKQMPDERCDVVKLATDTQHTTVRADSGGTRGHADEVVADSVLLMSPATKVELGGRIEVCNIPLRVTSVRPRLTVFGKVDHYEVGCAAWPSK